METESNNPDQVAEDMEIHHHAHHTHEKRNWKSYFWEFLMLFLAVTLGFFVENQREHYIEGQRAEEFSKSLIQDLHNDRIAIDAHQKTATTYNAFADSLMRLSQSRLVGRTAAEFGFYTRFMYWTGPIIWNRATFDQIKNSGSLRYFKNQSLLENLMKYEAIINIIEAEAYNRQVRGNLLIQQINDIIDPIYHQQLSKHYLMTIDSLFMTTRETIYPEKPESLENKRTEIKELLNMVIVQQRNLQRDMDVRWKEADEMAGTLIEELGNEYDH